MAQRKNAKGYSLYPYFDMYRTEETIEQSHQEIEQAIDSVTLSKLDRKIKKIWDRVLDSPD
jgi:hypothetical protein